MAYSVPPMRSKMTELYLFNELALEARFVRDALRTSDGAVMKKQQEGTKEECGILEEI